MPPHPISVVIAEDAAPMREALIALLGQADDITLLGVATDADGAADLCRQTRPDVAVLDVKMPNGGGPVAAAAIRDLSPQTQVVALTAHADASTRRTMTDAGAVTVIAKGGAIEDLMQAIRVAAGR